jgi:hypothetical protein
LLWQADEGRKTLLTRVLYACADDRDPSKPKPTTASSVSVTRLFCPDKKNTSSSLSALPQACRHRANSEHAGKEINRDGTCQIALNCHVNRVIAIETQHSRCNGKMRNGSSACLNPSILGRAQRAFKRGIRQICANCHPKFDPER